MICTVLISLLARTPHLLSVDGLIIARHDSRGWKSVEKMAKMRQRLTFTKFAVGKSSGTWTANGIDNQEPNDASYANGEAPLGALYTGPVTFPRPVRERALVPVYDAVLRRFLASKGVKGQSRVTRIISADLDGDGTAEVLIEGRNREDLLDEGMHSKSIGDYSVVLLRYLHNGRVTTYPLQFDHPGADGMNYMNKVLAVADLDGDGVMEVLLTSSYYEGRSATLFRYRRGHVTRLATGGDGV